MRNNIYNKVKAFCALMLAMGALCLTSCKEDKFTNRGDLFQPRFATDPAVKVTNYNDASIVWYQVNDAVSYTVQLYEDYYYQNLFMEQETKEPYIVIKDIPYAKRYYVRVRSNAADPVHNSMWALTDFTTEVRPDYAHIVQGVSKSEIEDDKAIIRWVVDAENPADSISIEPAIDKTLTSLTRTLTAEERAQGWMQATGLTPNTLYAVNLYDTSKPRRYDKPYNMVNFRTTGPAPETIQVDLLDDLSAILTANNSDPDIPEGTVYELPGGSTYVIRPLGGVSKGFRIVGPADEAKPVLVMNGSWGFANGAYVSKFSFENVEIRNQQINQYFFNTGNSYTVEEVSFTNVDFRNVYRGFWRHQASNVKHIQSFEMDGCWFDQCGWQSGTYGTFNFASAGKGEIGQYDQIDQIVIRNCTFSRGGSKQDPAWGWGNLINHSTTSAPINLIVENVTFYDFCVNQRLIDISNTEKSTVEIRNIIVASPMGEIITLGSGTRTAYSNNYVTTDYPLGGGLLRATELGKSAADIFEDPENGDYTIKDTGSLIYASKAGDNRWIK